jgi:hypothetical protein
MPLVNGRGPKWSRPLVKGAEERLSGLNPVRDFFARLFGVRSVAVPAVVSLGDDALDRGVARAGTAPPLAPAARPGSGAKGLGAE